MCGLAIFLFVSGARAGGDGTQVVVSDPDPAPLLANGQSTGFGHSLAWVGGSLVIGAPRSYRYGDRGGALWFWNKDGGEAEAITVPGDRDWSSLGWSLAAREGDPALAVGAPGEQIKGVASGAVHLLQKGSQAFHWLQRIEPTFPESNAGFGHAIRWSAGDLWISAPYSSGASGSQEGHVTRQESGPSGYRFKARLKSPSPQAGARFGEAMVVTDGALIVGAPGHQGGGAVFVMDKLHALGSPFQVLRQTAPLSPNAGFGSAMALSGDGLGLVIGAPWAGAGKVFVFERQASGPWRLRRQIHAPANSGAQGFGSGLAFSRGGLWIAAPGSDGQVFCMANWRSDLAPLQFAVGSQGVALGRALLPGGEQLCLGAPGHGIATFQPPVKASVQLEVKPSLQFFELPGKRYVHCVAYGAPCRGKVALGAVGLAPNRRVELRIWDEGEGGAWRRVCGGVTDATGAWDWAGMLPNPGSRAWKLVLHSCNATLGQFVVRSPGSR